MFALGPGAFAAAVEEAHSGEKQTYSDYAVGKTKGICEFTSFHMYLQGCFTKVRPGDSITVEISAAIGYYSAVTFTKQSGAYTCIQGCTTAGPLGPCL